MQRLYSSFTVADRN